jgi:hypothetical protein
MKKKRDIKTRVKAQYAELAAKDDLRRPRRESPRVAI